MIWRQELCLDLLLQGEFIVLSQSVLKGLIINYRYKIHELPIKPAKTVGQNENSCLTTKFVYNPRKTDIGFVPPNGTIILLI